MKKLRMGKEAIEEEKMLNRLKKEVGSGKIMGVFVIISDLLKIIPAEDLANLIIAFKSKYDIEQDMQETMLNMKNLLIFEKTVISEPLSEMLVEYRRRKEIAEIVNKKRWKKMIKKKEVSSALDNILKYYSGIKHEKSTSIRNRSRINIIEDKIKAIEDQENIEKNRRIRHMIERNAEKMRKREKKQELDKIQKELFSLFNSESYK